MLVIVASPLGLVLAVAAVVVADLDAIMASVVPRLEMITVVVVRLDVVAVVVAGLALAGAREAARRPPLPVVAAAAGKAVELPVALGDLRVARPGRAGARRRGTSEADRANGREGARSEGCSDDEGDDECMPA